MKKLIALISILFLASPVFADEPYNPDSACNFIVSGAGSTEVNGTYEYVGVSNGINEFSLDGATDNTTPTLRYSFSGYYELRTYAEGFYGWYYDNSASAGSYVTLDTANDGHSPPIPTVTQDCPGPSPVVGGTVTPSGAVWAMSALSIFTLINFVYFLIFFMILYVISWGILQVLKPIFRIITYGD